MIWYSFGLLMTYTMSICTHTFPDKRTPKVLFHNAYFIICFTCTWNTLFYASARCKTSSRLQCTALSQHLKQAHMCLYHSALSVCPAEALQIGTAPMLSEEAFNVTIFSFNSPWAHTAVAALNSTKQYKQGHFNTGFTYSHFLAFLWIFGGQMLTDMCNIKFDKTYFEKVL